MSKTIKLKNTKESKCDNNLKSDETVDNNVETMTNEINNINLSNFSNEDPLLELDESNLQLNIEEIDDQLPNDQQPYDFDPNQSDYLIRQQQIATYQMLSQFLTHQDRNVTETLNDIRISIDCLTKCVLQLNKNLEKHFVN